MESKHKKLKIKTFEERLLTAEERDERKNQREEDHALAAYYQSISENNEPAFIVSENPDDEILEDDAYIWDNDI